MSAMRVVLLILTLVTRVLESQETTRLVLQGANATLDEEFTEITWVRELRDGRVLIGDRRDNRVVLVDLSRRTIVPVGRAGQGPGEYSRAQRIWSIGGDSSVMVDGVQRWLMFEGARIVATLSQADAAVAATRQTVRGTDSLGNVYTAGTVAGQNGPMGDSTAILRISRSTGRVDTLGRLLAVVARQTSEPDKNGFFSFQVPTIQVAEELVPFADGWIAIARLNPYRVDWRSPDGTWTRRARLPVPSVAMDDREKRSLLERLASDNGKAPQPITSITDWPPSVPPWRSPNALFPAPDGRVVIPRLPSADHLESRYDIVNRQGKFDGQLAMPLRERIVGFGSNSVFVAAIDDNGIQRLRRHPWPARAAR